jgi:hypothetical protein
MEKEYEKYKCTECPFKSQYITNLKNHTLMYHSDIDTRRQSYPYYCELCDFGTFNKKVMDTHMKTSKHFKRFAYHKPARADNEIANIHVDLS